MYGFVRDILLDKGSQVFTIPSGAYVRDAVRLMKDRRIGALVVVDRGEITGIFTERDVLYRVVDAGLSPHTTRVAAVMSTPVLSVEPTTPVAEAMKTMTHQRVRHLPVLAQAELAGMVSIGDLLRRVTRTQETTIAQLTDYIVGRV